jgi:hypothetical protein
MDVVDFFGVKFFFKVGLLLRRAGRPLARPGFWMSVERSVVV